MKKLYRQLIPVKRILESITAEKEGVYPSKHKLNSEAHIHLHMAFWSIQSTCERFLSTFKECKNHSLSHYLHESDSGDFDFIEKTELRIFSERPQVFKYTILMAVETSVFSVEITL